MRRSKPCAARVRSASIFLTARMPTVGARNEELIARGVEGHRDEYVIASKFGNLRVPDGSPTSDGRPEYVKACCERSLKRLETDTIDLYYTIVSIRPCPSRTRSEQ